MKEKFTYLNVDKIQEEYQLPKIPDLFLIDDKGLKQMFRRATGQDLYSEYDKSYFQTHNAFFDDLELHRLFNHYLKIDKLENPHDQSIHELFFFLPTDIETIHYRQDILKDFIEDEELSQCIENSIKILKNEISEVSFSTAINKGLLLPYSRLLNDYDKVLTDLVTRFSSKKSQGLKELSEFLIKMKEHPNINIWKRYDKRIENEEPFYISLTRRFDFTPVAFSIVGFDNKSGELNNILSQAADRFGKIQTDNIDGSRLETVEVSLSYRHNRMRIPLMDLFVQIMMQVFGNPFEGMEDHVQYTIIALNQLNYYRKASMLFKMLESNGISCVFPEIRENNSREMNVEDAYNFLIDLETGKQLVPNNILSDKNSRIKIITGSNFGGKSCYMKTVGLIQLMGQIGLFVPARHASISMVDHVYTHFPEKEGAGDIESRYSWELERAKRICTYATPYSLSLFDEPCSGTTYHEGLLQTRTFVKISQQIGMTTYFTTHMHEIAKEIEESKDLFPNCQNLCVITENTAKGPRYTYRVMPGRVTHSGAAQLAEAKGCDEASLQKLLESRILTNSLPVDIE